MLRRLLKMNSYIEQSNVMNMKIEDAMIGCLQTLPYHMVPISSYTSQRPGFTLAPT